MISQENIHVSILHKATAQPLQQLMNYFRGQWMNHRTWGPQNWSVYGLAIRTNNETEGWHNRMNARCRPNLTFYLLVKLLNDEANLLPIQMRLVSDGKLKRHQNVTQKRLQAKIFTAWEEYAAGEKTAMQVLRDCAKVYAPV